MTEEFELFPKRSDGVMNRLIKQAAGRGEVATGGVDRLSGGIPAENGQMNRALERLETAARRGAGEAEIDYLERCLTDAVEASRAARQEREHPRDSETGKFVPAGSFDGGYRGKRGVAPPPRMKSPPTGAELVREGFRQALLERDGSSLIGNL
jgi:hypothetical protein